MGLELTAINLTYLAGTPMARTVLHNVDLTINAGEITCLMGRTGAGKSSLLQVLCGMMTPSSGSIALDGSAVESRSGRQALREAVGILMQSSERQLFAETVERDVAFGPQNQGIASEEALSLAREALATVGLDPEDYGPRSPFSLSEGEMRRVAMAGVLAMKPRYFLLDEPSSGLDAPGREILYHILETMQGEGKGILFVTHDWEEVEALADRVFLLSNGAAAAGGTVDEVLSDEDNLRRAGLFLPPLVELLCDLRSKGLDVPAYSPSPQHTAACIARALGKVNP